MCSPLCVQMATLEAAIAFLEQQNEAAALLAGTVGPAADEDDADDDDDDEPRDEHRQPQASGALPWQYVVTPHHLAAAKSSLISEGPGTLNLYAAPL